jgi:restriction system protein
MGWLGVIAFLLLLILIGFVSKFAENKRQDKLRAAEERIKFLIANTEYLGQLQAGFINNWLSNDALITGLVSSEPLTNDMRYKLKTEIHKIAERYFEQKKLEFFANVESRFNDLIQQHIKTLAVKRSQSITKDDYGNDQFDKWNQELDYFIDNVLVKDELISAYLHVDLVRSFANGHIHEIQVKIMDAVTEYRIKEIDSQDGPTVDVENLDPIAFEHHCAELLRNDGWNARVTQASGDQGIDLIATRGNVKAVFQCKKYAQPVGNGAVQEIVAGKQFEQADIAAVVSNATFTPLAKQLAGTTGVHLLYYSDLHGFAEKLGIA